MRKRWQLRKLETPTLSIQKYTEISQCNIRCQSEALRKVYLRTLQCFQCRTQSIRRHWSGRRRNIERAPTHFRFPKAYFTPLPSAIGRSAYKTASVKEHVMHAFCTLARVKRLALSVRYRKCMDFLRGWPAVWLVPALEWRLNDGHIGHNQNMV